MSNLILSSRLINIKESDLCIQAYYDDRNPLGTGSVGLTQIEEDNDAQIWQCIKPPKGLGSGINQVLLINEKYGLFLGNRDGQVLLLPPPEEVANYETELIWNVSNPVETQSENYNFLTFDNTQMLSSEDQTIVLASVSNDYQWNANFSGNEQRVIDNLDRLNILEISFNGSGSPIQISRLAITPEVFAKEAILFYYDQNTNVPVIIPANSATEQSAVYLIDESVLANAADSRAFLLINKNSGQGYRFPNQTSISVDNTQVEFRQFVQIFTNDPEEGETVDIQPPPPPMD